MDISITFIRIIFMIICLLLSTVYATSTLPDGLTPVNVIGGALGGLTFGAALVGLETMFRRFNLRTFNVAILGLFFGALLGQVIVFIFSSLIDFNAVQISPHASAFIKASIFLSTIYIGMVMTARGAEELYVSLPLVKFKSAALKKKDILLDPSVINDPRLIDLAASGLLDSHLVIPRVILTQLHEQYEKGEEVLKSRARRSLEVIKKLESLPSLELRYTDADFTDVKDPLERMVKLARMLDANILIADVGQIQQSMIEDVRIIKFQQLCNALKPLSQSGEFISIKIQRYGKEPRQGVGYLDDGTMVVVNGGAEYIGENVKAQVLSVKHTSSGRMIFCNASEDLFLEQPLDEEFSVKIDKSPIYTY